MKLLSSRERLIYGVNPIQEALKAKRRFLTLQIQKGRERALSEIIAAANRLSIKIEYIDNHYFEAHLPKGHQGIAARIVDTRDVTLEAILKGIETKKEVPLFLILDGIEDPRNFGAILRTAHCAGVHAVVHQKRGSTGFTATASKVSAGAIEHVEVLETSNIKHVMDKMIDADITLIATEQGSPVTLWDVDLAVPLALVIGGEDKAIRQTVRAKCQYAVSIPMVGVIGSLNVSVATGVFCFEVLRQRRKR
jgi:23S rRNA (guanosine2251-2'-O)-methyltransferase